MTHFGKLVLLVCFAIVAVAVKGQTATGKAYPTGNFLFCGKELPKKFSYLIEKQIDNQWKPVAELKTPVNAAECKMRLMSLPPVVASITKVDPVVSEFVWDRIQKPGSTLDSLFAYSVDPRYQFVAGTGWFDDDVKLPGTYKYRISSLSKSGETSLINEVSVAFPAPASDMKVQPLRYKLNPSGISLSYDVAGGKTIAGLKLFRSRYLQQSFKEVAPEMSFINQKGEMVALLTDNDVTNGLTYSYVAVPYDALGNEGIASDTVNVYFVSKPADIGMVTDFTVTPIPDRGGNLLKWSFRRSAYANVVEVYRSTTYNGTYKKIVSLGSQQTEYFDGLNISPAITYFYYIAINNGLGNSNPSARVPAILEGKRPNIIPPQDLTLAKKGNVVTLKFRRVGKDIRGYYAYRGDGYDAPLSQLPRMVLSTDSLVSYTDTLPASVNSSVYSYAVTSINTSYNISPLSNRVNTSYSGGRLPAPSNLDAKYRQGYVNVVWNNAADYNSAIIGYQLYRSVVSEEKETPEKLIAKVGFIANHFEDKDIVPGRSYIYRVRCITADTADVSSLSLPAGVYIPNDGIMTAGEVSAIAANDKMLLKWTLPLSEEIESVLVYRAEENEKASLMRTLPSTAENLEDTTVKKGVMYYYFIAIRYKNGLESKPTDAVSVKL